MKIKDIQDLRNITSEIIQVLNNYMAKNNDTPSSLARKIGIHPLQLLGFLRNERGIHISTIQRIGDKIIEWEKNNESIN